MSQISVGLESVVHPKVLPIRIGSPARYLSEQDVAEILQKFEAKTNIFQYQHNQVSIWQVLRFSISFRLQNLPHSKRPLPRSELIRSGLEGLKAWKLLSYQFKRKPNFVIFTYYSALRLKSHDLYRDVYSDDYLDAMPDGVKITRINAPGYRDRLSAQARKPLYDISGAMFFAGILRRFFRTRKVSPECRKIAELVESELGIKDLSAEDISNELNAFVWQTRIYQLVLAFLRPKVCITPDTCAYSLMNACRRLGIKFVELQHGIFTRHHPGILPQFAEKSRKELLFPTYIALYGKYWLDGLDKTLQADKGLLRVAGNPNLEIFRQMKQQMGNKTQGKAQVVVTTNGVDTQNMARFLSECMKILSSEIDLTIKLHPAYDPDASHYARVAAAYPGVKVVEGNANPNTFELIAAADLHLSLASACHYDSLAIGTPTAIIALSGYELVMPLINLGFAVLLKEPEDLRNLVRSIGMGQHRVPSHVQEEFCARNAIPTMESLLKV